MRGDEEVRKRGAITVMDREKGHTHQHAVAAISGQLMQDVKAHYDNQQRNQKTTSNTATTRIAISRGRGL